jgi:hypothetical protein
MRYYFLSQKISKGLTNKDFERPRRRKIRNGKSKEMRGLQGGGSAGCGSVHQTKYGPDAEPVSFHGHWYFFPMC